MAEDEARGFGRAYLAGARRASHILPMRQIIVALVLAAMAMPFLVAPVLAQAVLPRTSPSERQVEIINRDLALQRRFSEIERQQRFDDAMMRQRLQRLQALPPPQAPPIRR